MEDLQKKDNCWKIFRKLGKKICRNLTWGLNSAFSLRKSDHSCTYNKRIRSKQNSASRNKITNFLLNFLKTTSVLVRAASTAVTLTNLET